MADDSFITHFNEYVQAAKGSVDLLRTGVGLLPKGNDREQAQAEIDRAEHALKMSEAKIAQALGYNLCQCTFPPQIMLMDGRHPEHGVEIFKCANCGNQEPSEHKIGQLDRVAEHNRQGARNTWGPRGGRGSWMG